MSTTVKFGAIVLCGGKSQRMGQPKHLLPFGDECLLQRVANRLAKISRPVVVVASESQELPPLASSTIVCRDERPDLGPLSGLATGLNAIRAQTDIVYASSCDVPFLHPAFIKGLLDHLNESDIAIVKGKKHYHPLAAIYRTAIIPKLVELLDANRLRPIFLLEECNAVTVTEEQMREFDPDLETLRNINTPEQYAEALKLAGLS